METRGTIPVLVVGAGPTGLTLACDLLRRGVACRVIDKVATPFAGSRGKGVQPRGLEVLEDLGVLDGMKALGAAPYPPLHAYKGSQVVWTGLMHEHREPSPDVPHPLPLMLPQYLMEQALRARLAALGGRVEFATELSAFEQDGEGVTATLVSPGSEPERVRVLYLVGADGGHSLVRKRLGVPFEGETREDDRMLIADLHVDGLDRQAWHVWSDLETRKLEVGLCPLAGTDVFQLMAPLAPGEVPEQSEEGIQRLFNARSGRSDLRLYGVRWLSVFRTNIRLAERYRVGRVLLAGDAAHVHPPDGGQGLNTGIQDAYNLGWKLGEVLAGAPEALLDTYEEERLPIAAGVLGLSTRLHQRGVRSDANAPQRGAETEQLGLHYREGPLSRDERSVRGRVEAGDRAPDAPCHDAAGNALRLFDVFRGPHFTLLAFGSLPGDTVAGLEARYGARVRVRAVVPPGGGSGRHVLVDTHGHARRGYDLEGPALVLVRPDGYLGLVTPGLGTERVEDYLARVLAPSPRLGAVASA
ncbi:putative monooxygenase [Cystobacter fuscus]|uniref:Putative monooxygenase n=1 Tax=Cystobacter fuscus TaxID=43 RepID=A0A250JHF2_9BACT|nr:FAD-dependent oxidoreductase [Cystobacter fuscus]ATB43315.1 putative monooxygenase [Cystobacter fuscus]